MKLTGFGDYNWEADGYWAGLPVDYVPSVLISPQVISRVGATATFGPSTIGEHTIPVVFGYRGPLSYEDAWTRLLQRLQPTNAVPRQLRGVRNNGVQVNIPAVLSVSPTGGGEINTVNAQFTSVEAFWFGTAQVSATKTFSGATADAWLSIGSSTNTYSVGYASGTAEDPGFQPAPITLRLTPTAQRAATGPANSTLSRVTVTATAAVRLAAAASTRTALLVQATGGPVWIGGTSAVTAANGWPMDQGDEIRLEHAGEVWAIASSGAFEVSLIDEREEASPVGWTRRRVYRITNDLDEALVNYPWAIDLGRTDGLVAAGTAQASGNDLRVVYDGVEVARNLVDWNSATRNTLCWITIPALPPGESDDVEIWYGNPGAGSPPTYSGTARPAFDTTTGGDFRSTNGMWVYNVAETLENAGKGGWYLDSGFELPGLRDFSGPGAWRPVRTLVNTDSTAQQSYSEYVAGAQDCFTARFEAYRARNGVTLPAPDGDGLDGVAVTSPIGFTGVRFDAVWRNEAASDTDATPVGRLVLLRRDSAGDDWRPTWQNASLAAADTVIADQTVTFSTAKSVAFAVWPQDSREIDLAAGYDRETFARWRSVLMLLLATAGVTTRLAQAEEEIYEISGELRSGGDRTAPYRSVRIGQRAATATTTPRCAIRLNETLLVDMAQRRAIRYDTDGRTRLADIPYQALAAVDGVLSDETLVERPSPDWITVDPSVNLVDNASFDDDASGWSAGETAAGVTANLTRDTSQWSSAPASGRIAVGPNAAGAGAVAEKLVTTLYPLNGRASVQLGMDVRTSTTLLRPRLAVVWYDADGNVVERSVEPEWTPDADAWIRRAWAAAAPFDAAGYRIGVRVAAATAAATGNVWIDDVTLNGNDLAWDEDAPGTMTVDVRWTPTYR